MASELRMSFTVALPDDPLKSASALARIETMRDTFLAELQDAGHATEHEAKVVRLRDETGPRQPRRPAALPAAAE